MVSIGVVEQVGDHLRDLHGPDGQKHRRQVPPCQDVTVVDEPLLVGAGEPEEPVGVDVQLAGGRVSGNPSVELRLAGGQQPRIVDRRGDQDRQVAEL
ncbi:MAG: hypothetical protein ACYTBR_08000, partial [Planctomycetota bacterium]